MDTRIITVAAISPKYALHGPNDGPPSGFRFVYIQEGEAMIVSYRLAESLERGHRYEVEVGKWWGRIPPYTRIKRIIRSL